MAVLRLVTRCAGLNRTGKSCRLRWLTVQIAMRYVWIPRLPERIWASSEDQHGSGTKWRRSNGSCTHLYTGLELQVASNSDNSETTGHPIIENGSVTERVELEDSPENLWSDENLILSNAYELTALLK